MSGGQFYRVFPSLCVAGGAARYRLLLLLALHLSSWVCSSGHAKATGDSLGTMEPSSQALCLAWGQVHAILYWPRGAALQSPVLAGSPAAGAVAVASPGWRVWVLLACWAPSFLGLPLVT